MFAALESQIGALIHVLPLPWFAFLASFIEEVVAPIPSPFVMLSAGAFARLQGWEVNGLILLALVGALGKTCGALCVYWIADKAEDVVLGRYARFFGVTHTDIERLSSKLTGTPRDYVFMTVLRSLPILPSVLVSIGSGILKVPYRLFIISTFAGTLIRDGLYLYVGYKGTEVLRQMIATSDRVEDVILVGVLLTAGVVWAMWYLRRKRRTSSGS